MDLILWRHAEATELHHGDAADLARRLTPRGERQARRMAEWLRPRLEPATRIVASPALRCQQTAAVLGREVETLDALAPDAGVDAFLRAVGWPDAERAVLVIGHQPTLGLVAARLVGGRAEPWAVKKAAVWWLRGREREGVRQVVIEAVVAPDGIREDGG